VLAKIGSATVERNLMVRVAQQAFHLLFSLHYLEVLHTSDWGFFFVGGLRELDSAIREG